MGLDIRFWVVEGSIWLRVKAFRAWASVFGGFEGSIWLKVKLCGVWVGALGG